MGMRALEAAILAEAKQVTGNKKLRQKDILEWTTGEISPRDNEQVYRLPVCGVNVAVETKNPETANHRNG
jgi:hypothetical protein